MEDHEKFDGIMKVVTLFVFIIAVIIALFKVNKLDLTLDSVKSNIENLAVEEENNTASSDYIDDEIVNNNENNIQNSIENIVQNIINNSIE